MHSEQLVLQNFFFQAVEFILAQFRKYKAILYRTAVIKNGGSGM